MDNYNKNIAIVQAKAPTPRTISVLPSKEVEERLLLSQALPRVSHWEHAAWIWRFTHSELEGRFSVFVYSLRRRAISFGGIGLLI